MVKKQSSTEIAASKVLLEKLYKELDKQKKEKPNPPTDLYRHYDKDNKLLYVGISLSAIKRLSGHRRHSGWYSKITRVEIEHHPSREAAEFAEMIAIWSENPKYNKVFKNIKRPENICPHKWVICRLADKWKVSVRTIMLFSLSMYVSLKGDDNRNLYGWIIKACTKNGEPIDAHQSYSLFKEMMEVQAKKIGGKAEDYTTIKPSEMRLIYV